jgi:hypothetical protein
LESFIAKSGKKTPLVLGRQEDDSTLLLLMERQNLVGCNKKHDEFLKTLKNNAAEKDLKIEIQV